MSALLPQAFNVFLEPLMALNVQNLTNKAYVWQCTSDLDCYSG
ncbi:hypothetical protein [Pseudomonas nabeulensis]|nr:hypothetical protein [Pseudomonas nabeulensis]